MDIPGDIWAARPRLEEIHIFHATLPAPGVKRACSSAMHIKCIHPDRVYLWGTYHKLKEMSSEVFPKTEVTSAVDIEGLAPAPRRAMLPALGAVAAAWGVVAACGVLGWLSVCVWGAWTCALIVSHNAFDIDARDMFDMFCTSVAIVYLTFCCVIPGVALFIASVTEPDLTVCYKNEQAA